MESAIMAKPQGKILFTDDAPAQNNLSFNNNSTKNAYKPKILFQDEAQQEDTGTGLHGVRQDIVNAVNSIPDVIHAIPGEASGIGQQYKNEPGRIGKNLLAGIGEGGVGLLNTPHNIIKYLGKKELIPEWLKNYNEKPWTHIPEDLGVEKSMGLGEQKPGDEALKLLPQLFGGYGLKKILGPRSLGSFEKELNANKNFIENATEQHKQFLNEGQEHSARVSKIIKETIEGKPTTIPHPETGLPKQVTEGGLRREIGSKYDQLESSLPDVTIPGAVDTKAIDKELKQLIGGKSDVSEKDKAKFKAILEQTANKSKEKTIGGREFFRAYRSLRRIESEQRAKAYSHGISPETHDEWIARANKTKQTHQDMENIINKYFPEDTLKNLHQINHEYSNIIAPLDENKLYQEMKEHGQTSKNIMKYLHGTTKGNNTLNAIVERNPELQRYVVGQQFASKPENLAQGGEVLNKYKALNPNIAKIIEEQQAAHTYKEKIPELQDAIKQLTEKKVARKSFRRNVAATTGGLGLVYAIETALGRDWKKDFPSLVEAYKINKLRKIK